MASADRTTAGGSSRLGIWLKPNASKACARPGPYIDGMDFRAEAERLNLDPKAFNFIQNLLSSMDDLGQSNIALEQANEVLGYKAAALEQTTVRLEQSNVALEVQNQKLKFEVAHLRRLRFGAKTEAFSADQKRLFEDDLGEDIAAVEAMIEAALPAKSRKPPCRSSALTGSSTAY